MKQKEAQDKNKRSWRVYCKNKARAATATLAQSKVKILKNGSLEDIVYEKDLKFDFNYKDTSAKYLLEVKDVSFDMIKVIFFQRYNFALSRGETLGIIGKWKVNLHF